MYEVEMIGGGRFSAWPMIWRLCPISPQIMGWGWVELEQARGTDSQICHSAARSPTLPRLNCWLVIEDCDRHEKCEKWYDDECEKKYATQILYSLTRALFGLYWRLQPDKALDVFESVGKFFVQTRLHIKAPPLPLWLDVADYIWWDVHLYPYVLGSRSGRGGLFCAKTPSALTM